MSTLSEVCALETVGVVGLGDMGSGMARNLVEHGFDVVGYNRSDAPMKALAAYGGVPADSLADLGAAAGIVFVMVLDGRQAKAVCDDLAKVLGPGNVVVLTATIDPSEARNIAKALNAAGIDMIDSPVSGGYPGAQGGTLTMMAAGDEAVLDRCAAAMEAVSSNIYRVGDEPGMGQTAKACLQVVVGAAIAATCEAAVLADQAGVDGAIFRKIVATSAAGSPIADIALENILARQFERTGSRLQTLHKDLAITLEMAKEFGVPLATTSAAMQLVEAAKIKHPDADNWAMTRVVEELVVSEPHRRHTPT